MNSNITCKFNKGPIKTMRQTCAPVQILQSQLLFDLTEELSDMRKQMKALEEKNVTYMKETMNLQEVLMARLIENIHK